MENKRLYPDFQLEDYVSNYSESEIDLLTQFKLVVKGEEGFVVMFSSIPDEKLEAVIECCKGKTNVAIKIMKEDRERFMNCNYSFHDVIVEYSCDTVSQATEEVINRFGEARILIGGRNNFNSRQIPIQKYRFILQKLRKIIKDITMDQPEEERFKYEENNSEREEKNRFREKYHVEDSSKQKNIANTLKENSGENIKGEKTDKIIEQQFDI